MLNFHSTGVSGICKAEIFFPNNFGASILRRSTPDEPDEFEITVVSGTEDNFDINPHTCLLTNEEGCDYLLNSIRMLAPD